MDASSESGSMPWLIVRLPWGSRSTQSTRCPRSTNAAARFSVVVVLATPPFWLVNAMTFALASITQAVFARAGRNPSPFASDAFVIGQAAGARHGQGRGRKDDHRRRPRADRRAGRQARGAVRGGRADASRRGAEPHPPRRPRARLRRPRGREAGVASLPVEVAHARRGA